jgi:hypothetical protein
MGNKPIIFGEPLSQIDQIILMLKLALSIYFGIEHVKIV